MGRALKHAWIPLLLIVVLAVSGLVVSRLHRMFASADLNAGAGAGIEIVHEAVYETAGGKRLLVLHGDRFDGVIACAKWLAHVGDRTGADWKARIAQWRSRLEA